MNAWMGWTAGVCCAAAACALLEQLHPSGAMRKAAQCVLALFFLAVLILPLPEIAWPDGSGAAQTAETADRADELTNLMRRQMVRAATEQVEQAVRDRLAEIEVTPVRVTAQLTADGDAVRLERLTIVLRSGDRMYEKTVRIRMQALLNDEPEIRYE